VGDELGGRHGGGNFHACGIPNNEPASEIRALDILLYK
jgi:hypothetical protein